MGLEALRDPVGPLSPRVYWRRRITVILGIILIIVLFKSCTGGGDGKKTPSSLGTNKTSPSPTAKPSSSASSSSPTPATNTVTPCVDTQLSLAVTSDAATYPAGAPARLTLKVTNNGPSPCSRDLSPAQQGFVISSGGVRTWSSTDCASPAPKVQTINPKETKTYQVPWNRRWSDVSCTASTSARIADVGTYTVKGILGTLSKDGPVIVLSN